VGEKRIAIVTGSGSGIGKAIARQLAANGYNVMINDVVQDKVDAAVAEFEAEGLSVSGQVADVSTREGAEQLVQGTLDRFGGLHVLVNNVGILRDNLITNMPEEDWDLVLRVNLKSYFLMIKAAVPHMIAQKHGRIVNISSRAWLGNVGQANYSASKGGVVSLTRAMALELGRHGITVNAIAPGLIDTPLTRNLRPDVWDRLVKAQPTRTAGTPDDVAWAVRFFAAPESGFITGQVLHVCGGKSVKSDW